MSRTLQPGSVSVTGTVTTLTSVSVRIPLTPTIDTPASGNTIQYFNANTITSSAMFVYNTTYTHTGSNWQVAADADFQNVLYDFATNTQKTYLTLPMTLLPRTNDQDYYVRVRYVNSADEISDWSAGSVIHVEHNAEDYTASANIANTTHYNVIVGYLNTGSPDTLTIEVANTANMSSIIWANTTANFDYTTKTAVIQIPFATMPGFISNTTPYYIRAYPLGANSINTTSNPIAINAPSVSALYNTARILDTSGISLSANTVGANTVSTIGNGNNIRVQYSTSSDFSTISYQTTSANAVFAASNLPGVWTLSTWYRRPVYVIANENEYVVANTTQSNSFFNTSSLASGGTATAMFYTAAGNIVQTRAFGPVPSVSGTGLVDSLSSGNQTVQYSTSSSYTTTTYTNSSNTTFNQSNLPGLSDRSAGYYFRPAYSLGGSLYVGAGPSDRMNAIQELTSGSGTFPLNNYVGTVRFTIVGGGGGGTGGTSGAPAGGGAGMQTTPLLPVTSNTSFTYSVGNGGPGTGWGGGGGGGGTSSVTFSGSTYSSTGGGLVSAGSPNGAAGGPAGGTPGTPSTFGGGSGGPGGTPSSGGQGGQGRGAGGGGQSRLEGGFGLGGGGGGGYTANGALYTSTYGGNGTADNVGSGGGGAGGVIIVEYTDW